MKDFRFYLEYESPAKKRKGEDRGNILAVFTDKEFWFMIGDEWVTECISSLMDTPNCANICGSQVSLSYLRMKCKRVSEQKAREIHPNLFAYLDRQ